MRHPGEKVKEAILHADQDVRTAAVYYFANAHSSDPTVMPLVIQARLSVDECMKAIRDDPWFMP